MSALAILRLIPDPPGRIVGGRVMFGGEDLTRVGVARIRQIRGNDISMIFQEPMTSQNPMMTIGRQIMEPLRRHRGLGHSRAPRRRMRRWTGSRFPTPRGGSTGIPHEMSGGMRQRVVIAIALACDPQVLIADEPTTALDVTIQSQILDLIADLQATTGRAVVMITHDPGVVAETADRVVIMYAGRKVEKAPVHALFANPRHPYTVGLMRALLRLDRVATLGFDWRLAAIPGMVPALDAPPQGCAFADRCPLVSTRCRQDRPNLEERSPGHIVACWEASG